MQEAESESIDEVQYLLKTRAIYVYGEINDETAHKFVAQLHFLEFASEEPITVYLKSDGGEIGCGYSIYDALRQSRCYITIKAFTACSIAAAILQGADRRQLFENGQFMIHNGSVGAGELKANDAVDLAEQILKENTHYYQILTRSGQKIEQIAEWCKGDKYMDAEEAVRNGFADEVISPVKTFAKKPRKYTKRK